MAKIIKFISKKDKAGYEKADAIKQAVEQMAKTNMQITLLKLLDKIDKGKVSGIGLVVCDSEYNSQTLTHHKDMESQCALLEGAHKLMDKLTTTKKGN